MFLRLSLIEAEIEMENAQMSSILNQIEIKTIGMIRCFSFNDKRLAYCDHFTRNRKDKRNHLNIQLQIQSKHMIL